MVVRSGGEKWWWCAAVEHVTRAGTCTPRWAMTALLCAMQRALPMMRKKTDPAKMYSVFCGTGTSPVKCLTSTLRTIMGPKESTEFMKNRPMPYHSSDGE